MKMHHWTSNVTFHIVGWGVSFLGFRLDFKRCRHSRRRQNFSHHHHSFEFEKNFRKSSFLFVFVNFKSVRADDNNNNDVVNDENDRPEAQAILKTRKRD